MARSAAVNPNASNHTRPDVPPLLRKLAARSWRLLAVTAIRGWSRWSLRKGLPWPAVAVPLTLAVGLTSSVRPLVVVAALTVVLVSEVVAGLAKQREDTPGTAALENEP